MEYKKLEPIKVKVIEDVNIYHLFFKKGDVTDISHHLQRTVGFHQALSAGKLEKVGAPEVNISGEKKKK